MPLWRHFLGRLGRAGLLLMLGVLPLLALTPPPSQEVAEAYLYRDLLRARRNSALAAQQPTPSKLFRLQGGVVVESWPAGASPHRATAQLPTGRSGRVAWRPRTFALRVPGRQSQEEWWAEARLPLGLYQIEGSWPAALRLMLGLLATFGLLTWVGVGWIRKVEQDLRALAAMARGERSEIPPAEQSELVDLQTSFAQLERELLSRQRALEAAVSERQQAGEEVHRLLAEVSHDLRTPLTAILGYAQLYEESTGHSLEHLRSPSQQLLGQVESWLEGCRLESRALQLKREEVHVHDCLEEAYFLARGWKPLELSLQLPPRSPVLRGDGFILSRVLASLMSELGSPLQLTVFEGRLELSGGDPKGELSGPLSLSRCRELIELQGLQLELRPGWLCLSWEGA